VHKFYILKITTCVMTENDRRWAQNVQVQHRPIGWPKKLAHFLYAL